MPHHKSIFVVPRETLHILNLKIKLFKSKNFDF